MSMSATELHPVIPLALAFLAMPLVGLWGRRALSLIAPLMSLALVVAIPEGATQTVQTLGHDWVLLEMTTISRLFAFAFALYGFLAGLYAWTETGAAPKAWSMLLVVGGVGTALAGDWLSLFFFWEMLSTASFFLVWLGRDPDAQGAGFRYAMFHMAGGVCLLGGVLWQIQIGEPAVAALTLDNGAAWAILIGLVTNAAVPPLHAWLPDAYPRATIFGTVFLAAFTTKSAVYVLCRAFPGADVLVVAGAIMAVYGVVFAVLENDIRRLLGYHIISQVGYMVCGAGVGTALAINGSSAHAFCHIFYKGLLLMSAGAVIHVTGRGKLSDLGQLARPMKWTCVMIMIGALSIAGAPLLNGFVSKSMVVSSAVDSDWPAIEMLLLIASMGTFLSIGLKLAWFTFAGPDHGATVRRALPASMMAAMVLSAAICIYTGVPGGYQTLYDALPVPTIGHAEYGYEAKGGAAAHDGDAGHETGHDASAADAHGDYAAADGHGEEKHSYYAVTAAGNIHYPVYTADHVVGSLQLLIGTALGFWLLRGMLKPKPKITLDVDRLYRSPIAVTVGVTGETARGFGRVFEQTVLVGIRAAWAALQGFQAVRRNLGVAHQLTVVVFVLAAVAYLVLSAMG
jgi:multicomponent Na+:H+ antiporter subunit D